MFNIVHSTFLFLVGQFRSKKIQDVSVYEYVFAILSKCNHTGAQIIQGMVNTVCKLPKKTEFAIPALSTRVLLVLDILFH